MIRRLLSSAQLMVLALALIQFGDPTVASANDILDQSAVTVAASQGDEAGCSANYAIVHYNREDGDYGDHTTGDFNDFWGLHLWGNGIGSGEITQWSAPKPFLGEDDYGRFAWIRLDPGGGLVNFIVHRGDTKDGTDADRQFDPAASPEIWIKQDDGSEYVSQAMAQGFATVRYHRPGGDYGDYTSGDFNDFWGLHLWGDAIDATEVTNWTAPKKPDQIDDYGPIWHVLLQDSSQPVNFIIHRGDLKDPGPDQNFTPNEIPTAWIESGDTEVYAQRGSAEGYASVHYHRPAGDYGDPTSPDYNDFWGLHVWTGAQNPTDWPDPLRPEDFDIFGAVFKVPLVSGATQLGYILHRGDELDPGSDQFLNLVTSGHEVWQLQGADPAEPYILPIPCATLAYAGSIHAFKFEDLNADGIYDSNEPPQAGVEFTLTGIDSTGNPVGPIVDASTPNGVVQFLNLQPGTYTVTESIPAGYQTSTHDANDPSVTVTVASGQEYVALAGMAQLPAGTSKYETVEERLIFGNRQTTEITITKVCNRYVDGDPQFNITGSTVGDDPTQLFGQLFSCEQSHVIRDLNPGNYRFAEQATNNWVLNNISCSADNGSSYTPDPASGSVDISLGENGSVNCTFNNYLVENAAFYVTKDFTDDNPAGVMVQIDCNTGLKSAKSHMIYDEITSSINFVVTKFIPGQLTCSITETSFPAGYTDSYTAGIGVAGIADSISDGDAACIFRGVVGGDFTCEIFNQADPATFTVRKDWIIVNNGGDSVTEKAAVTISCESEIIDGRYNSNTHTWQKSRDLGDGDSLTARIDTADEPATCWASEKIYQSGVEGSGDCGPRQIFAGGFSECTFVNTVFFEGVPTLNQLGLALLALLMLVVGTQSLRRFV